MIVPAATAKTQYRLYRDCQVSTVGAEIASRPASEETSVPSDRDLSLVDTPGPERKR